MRARSAVLAVRSQIVVIEWIVTHGKAATGGFLRYRKPDAVNAIATGDVSQRSRFGLHGRIPGGRAVPIEALHHHSCQQRWYGVKDVEEGHWHSKARRPKMREARAIW